MPEWQTLPQMVTVNIRRGQVIKSLFKNFLRFNPLYVRESLMIAALVHLRFMHNWISKDNEDLERKFWKLLQSKFESLNDMDTGINQEIENHTLDIPSRESSVMRASRKTL